MKRKSKRPYRAMEVNGVSVDSVLERSKSERLVVAIDVAKEKMVAAVMDEEEEVLITVKWSHPKESNAFYAFMDGLKEKPNLPTSLSPTGASLEMSTTHTNDLITTAIMSTSKSCLLAPVSNTSSHLPKSSLT